MMFSVPRNCVSQVAEASAEKIQLRFDTWRGVSEFRVARLDVVSFLDVLFLLLRNSGLRVFQFSHLARRHSARLSETLSIALPGPCDVCCDVFGSARRLVHLRTAPLHLVHLSFF